MDSRCDERQPTVRELADLKFASRVAKACEVERHRLCQGWSDGGDRRRQMSRIDSARIADGNPRKRQRRLALQTTGEGFGGGLDAFFPRSPTACWRRRRREQRL